MNERINLLTAQALDEVVPYTWTTLNCDEIQKLQERLVELIVQECANYINERTLDWDADLRWIFNDGSGDMAVDVDDLLNRHFGVE